MTSYDTIMAESKRWSQSIYPLQSPPFQSQSPHPVLSAPSRSATIRSSASFSDRATGEPQQLSFSYPVQLSPQSFLQQDVRHFVPIIESASSTTTDPERAARERKILPAPYPFQLPPAYGSPQPTPLMPALSGKGEMNAAANASKRPVSYPLQSPPSSLRTPQTVPASPARWSDTSDRTAASSGRATHATQELPNLRRPYPLQTPPPESPRVTGRSSPTMEKTEPSQEHLQTTGTTQCTDAEYNTIAGSTTKESANGLSGLPRIDRPRPPYPSQTTSAGIHRPFSPTPEKSERTTASSPRESNDGPSGLRQVDRSCQLTPVQLTAAASSREPADGLQSLPQANRPFSLTPEKTEPAAASSPTLSADGFSAVSCGLDTQQLSKLRQPYPLQAPPPDSPRLSPARWSEANDRNAVSSGRAAQELSKPRRPYPLQTPPPEPDSPRASRPSPIAPEKTERTTGSSTVNSGDGLSRLPRVSRSFPPTPEKTESIAASSPTESTHGLPRLPRNIRALRDGKNGKLLGRTIVICLDGTGDKFDSDNSNIVHLVSCLKKSDPSQITYYQSGIGTYDGGGLSNGFNAAMDMAIGSGLGVHIRDAYHFLMQNYKDNDRICLFGFSRGAYTARCVAGMVHKVGLLPAHNIQQIPFAYQYYKDDSEKGWDMSGEFKRTFCMDVSVHFIGVFDSVASVGFIPRTLPLSSTPWNKATYFRHAMALDEHRAKYVYLRV